MTAESHTLAWMRRLDEKFDRLDAKVTDLKGDVTELAGMRLKLAEPQRRVDQIEASQAKPSP